MPRKAGSLNHTTIEARELCRNLFDKEYWDALKARLLKGKVHPRVEMRLLAYAFGEPAKVLTVQGGVTVEDKRRALRHIPTDVLERALAAGESESPDVQGSDDVH
jgi:hypothetical protein